MLRIKKLYTIPPVISPIEFDDGLNFILGEEDSSSNKTNGVGKSLCVEFINFALLKAKSKSRVSLIPDTIFQKENLICLDIQLGETPYTIKRSLLHSEQPTISSPEGEITFSKLDDATAFLTGKLFPKENLDHPSFRAMLGPLMRDERSEFKSLLRCYDTKYNIPDDYAPHLFILGISVTLYQDIKTHISQLDDIASDLRKIKNNIKLIRQTDIKDARADLNELDNEILTIEKEIDALENIAGYDLIKIDIIKIEEKLEEQRIAQTILRQKLSRLTPIAKEVTIEPEEIKDFYNNIKTGLGDLIAKDLNEVFVFKEKIESFQNELIFDRRKALQKELNELSCSLTSLDRQYKEKLSVLDQQGNLKNLKQTYAALHAKIDEASQLKSFIGKYEELEGEKQRTRSSKETDLLRLQSNIQENQIFLDNFEKTILHVHEFVQGNRKASFKITKTTKKQVIEFTMRIDDDGSHSVEREKVFIYDIALLLNDHTRQRHPGFLLHDNIFDVDQDTLIKNLIFLLEKAHIGSQQYILTLNADRLIQGSWTSDYDHLLKEYTRATFTKANRFLKQKYQEKY